MTLDPRRAAVMVEHSGQTYYLCSEGCKQKFLAQPDLFLNKAPGMRLTSRRDGLGQRRIFVRRQGPG
jgi:YHS domain-containing protein